MRWLSLCVALLAITSCIRSGTTTCADGTLCRDGTLCAPDGERTLCVTPEQLDACSDKTPHAPCGADRCYQIDDGLVCLPIGCGNGFADTEEREQCDDGNTVSGDGCSADCLSTERCGNGVVDPLFGEQCDDENIVSHDGCSSRCGVETIDFTRFASPGLTRSGSGMVFDARRARLVEIGGALTGFGFPQSVLEWERRGVEDLSRASAPDGRRDVAVAYDVRRGVTVMFGGERDTGMRADVWEWNGGDWRALDAAGPLARRSAAMTYDEVLDRVVLFGGQGKEVYGDTWQLAGGSWTQVTSGGPPPSASPVMTFDPVDGVVVLVAEGRQWELAGSTWRLVGDVPAPMDQPHWIVFDTSLGQRVLLGVQNAQLRQWAWVQQQWQPLSRTPIPANLVRGVVADRVRGGIIARLPTELAIWSADGTLTYHANQSSGDPAALRGSAGANDLLRGQVVVFGGNLSSRDAPVLLGTTWIFDGFAWIDARPAAKPSPRWEHAMAYDRANDRVVLFGGRTTGGLTNETWLWNGTTWTKANASMSPTARAGHAMTYDAERGRVVLFGGIDAGGLKDDAWEWDGSTWAPVAVPSAGPSPRLGAAMAYDPIGGGVVVFGGGVDPLMSDGLADTWRLSPTGWQPIDLVIIPTQRMRATLTWVPSRRRLVLFGGETVDTSGIVPSVRPTLDTWEWDGSRWRALPTTRALLSEHVAFAAIDGGGWVTLGGNIALSGGLTTPEAQMTYRWSDKGAYETCGSRLDADGDGAAACADPDCWSQCTPLCMPGETGCPSAPACGDQSCASIETSWVCPADCGAAPVACGDGVCDPSETCAGDAAISTCP